MNTVRQNAATLGPGWNKTFLNYALAVEALEKLPFAHRNSWKFLAAMHGFHRDLWIEEKELASDDPIPSDVVNGTYGNQCQHGSWYFLPWHRAYLHAFETIIAVKVKELTGDDWALPYWNYLDRDNPDALKIPEAFLTPTMPNGRVNPLSRYARHPNLSALDPDVYDFSLDAMEDDAFTVGGATAVGFGGGGPGRFDQFGGSSGALEFNPHNSVHGLIGGLMGNALTAGFDPIFWLHHCNIDRLWEAWMRTPGKQMVREARWLDGPVDRRFIMPTPGGADLGLTFVCRDTLRGGKLYRDYDDLTRGTGVSPGEPAVTRVGMGPAEQQRVDWVGDNAAAVRVTAVPVSTQVKLLPEPVGTSVTAMGAVAPGTEVARLYLALHSVRGKAPSPVLDVYVNLPDGVDPQLHPENRAGRVTLFGLNVASDPDGAHAGNGLGLTLDITDLAQRLIAAGNFDLESLRVTLVPLKQISEASPVTVEKIGLLKRSGVVT